MSTISTRGRRVASFVLTDPRVIGFLTLAYVAFGLIFVRTGYTLHDEGLLTHYWASWARQDFVPVFFFQKVKPVLAALYAPFSAGGVRATMVAHVIVASTSIPMIASTARALGHRLPNLPAVILALSPIFFFGGSAGLSNIDGLVGVLLVFYLLSAWRRPVLAGMVTGLLPWVRFELAVFSFVIGLYAVVWKRDRALLLGLVIFPLLYGLLGALYHHDLLWIAHFPPSAPYDPSNPIWQFEKIGPQYFLEPALALSPAAALVVALHMSRLRRIERVALVYGLAATATVQILPIFKIGNFGAAPRYSIHVLPALALLLSRAVEPWWDGERLPPGRLFVVLAVAAWMATRQADPRVVVGLLVAYGALGTVAWLRPGALAVMLVAVLSAAGPILPVRFEVGRAITASYLDPVVGWLESHPEEADVPIYTNSQLLAPFLESRGWPTQRIFFLTGVDMTHEALLVNPNNDQLERIGRLAKSDLYGRAVLGPFSPADVPDGSLFALRMDSRLGLLLPESIWGPHLEVLTQSREYRIARFHRSAAKS